jgi:hypothetical protein
MFTRDIGIGGELVKPIPREGGAAMRNLCLIDTRRGELSSSRDRDARTRRLTSVYSSRLSTP